MHRAVLLISVLAASAAGSGAHASNLPPKSVGVSVAVQPQVVVLHQRAQIAVSGIRVRSLQVRLAGATDAKGRELPWRPLRSVGGAWVGMLPAPALHGVYPVLLRVPGASPFTSGRLLRVFHPGTRARPTFGGPLEVARWWVRNVAHGSLVAWKAWPRPGFDRRDVRLHKLFVVAYTLGGHTAVRDRLGMFVTAFRDGYGARWQLLEATVEP